MEGRWGVAKVSVDKFCRLPLPTPQPAAMPGGGKKAAKKAAQRQRNAAMATSPQAAAVASRAVPDGGIATVNSYSSLGEYDPRRACAEKSAAQHTKWSRSYLQAAELVHDAVAAAERSPYNRTTYGSHRDVPEEVHSDPHNIHACCCLIKAMLLTDFRLQIESTILQLLPGSETTHHITADCMASEDEYRLVERGQPMLINMGVGHLVTILCDGLRSMYTGSRGTYVGRAPPGVG